MVKQRKGGREEGQVEGLMRKWSREDSKERKGDTIVDRMQDDLKSHWVQYSNCKLCGCTFQPTEHPSSHQPLTLP